MELIKAEISLGLASVSRAKGDLEKALEHTEFVYMKYTEKKHETC